MPGQIVATQAQSGTLALGVSRDYWDAYGQAEQDSLNGNLGKIVMEMTGQSDHAKLAYYEACPIPSLWSRSTQAQSKSFKDVGWTIPVYEWEMTVEWRWTDAQDDQTTSLKQRAQDAGSGFWIRDESVFFQMLNAGTDVDGLPAVPNASDGVAMFNATDGAGAARFGVSGGNIVSGQLFNSGAAIRAGFQAAHSRLGRFQNTVSQPLFGNLKRFLVIGSMTDLAAYNEAYRQTFVAQAATTATSNAGVSNVLFDAGYEISLWLTQRVATGVMFVFALDTRVKPLIRLNREKPMENPITMANSDVARRTGNEGTQFISRTGYGVGLPYGAIKVTT